MHLYQTTQHQSIKLDCGLEGERFESRQGQELFHL
jgi:hypothetical protein